MSSRNLLLLVDDTAQKGCRSQEKDTLSLEKGEAVEN
jgi:hypothetical protein